MYPTITEQIASLKRVIKDVVRPAVSSEYAENVLYFTVRLLNSLALEAVAAHPANVREVTQLAQLFEALLPELRRGVSKLPIDSVLVKEIEGLSKATLADYADVETAQRLVSHMREVAAKVIRVVAFVPGASSCTAAISRYVRELCDLQGKLFMVGK